MQTAKILFLVRPSHFGFNPETAVTNRFQSDAQVSNSALKARQEFDAVIARMQGESIDVLILDDDPDNATPDAVFPNNWVSFHHSGQMIIYPMLSKARRRERRLEPVRELMSAHGLHTSDLVDMTEFEKSGKYLEGTGSIVFDHISKIAYAALSPRTHQEPLEKLCSILSYRPHVFNTFDQDGFPFYHTNVVMAVGERFAVICPGVVTDNKQQINLFNQLVTDGRELIEVNKAQMASFACNILEVRNSKGDPFILLSQTSLQALTTKQRTKLESFATLLPVTIPTIETIGGGSIRCMISEVFLPRKSGQAQINVKKAVSIDELEQLFELRWKVLRAPWNQPPGTVRDDMEDNARQFIAKNQSGKVIGTGRLQETARGVGQIRFMAVDPDWQGKGIGKLLVEGMETEARQMGIKTLFLQARDGAVPFYQAMGYNIIEKSFLLFDSIQHYRMEKAL